MEVLSFAERIKASKEQAIRENKIIHLRRQDLDHKRESVVDMTSCSGKLGYSWYQTHTRVGIDIPYMLKQKSQLVTDFKEQHITITFPLSLGGEFNLELELFGKIVPEGSKGMVHLNRIEIQLEKLEKNVNWPHLKTEFKQSMELTEEYKASYPTSSNKKKDWDKLEKEISVDISKNKEEYGEDPLNSLFKEIFKNADEDKRRAMVKSFQTSDGTVLSTDWGDVKAKDYEGKDRPSPPKGQQWKKSN